MDIMDIRDIMNIMDIMDIMDIMYIVIMIITAWMAMAGAVSALVWFDRCFRFFVFCIGLVFFFLFLPSFS